MVHDLLPFFIVAAIVCGGVLVFLFIDHLRAERRWKRAVTLAAPVVPRNEPPEKKHFSLKRFIVRNQAFYGMVPKKKGGAA